MAAFSPPPLTPECSRLWKRPPYHPECPICSAKQGMKGSCKRHGFLGGGTYGMVYEGVPKQHVKNVGKVAMKILHNKKRTTKVILLLDEKIQN